MDRVYRQDRHLSSALIYTEIDKIIGYLDGRRKYDELTTSQQKLITSAKLNNVSRVHEKPFPLVLNHLYGRIHNIPNTATNSLIECTKVAEICANWSLAWWMHNTEVNTSNIRNDLGFLVCPEIVALWNVRAILDDFIQENSSSTEYETGSLMIGDFRWIGYGELGVVTFERTSWICPYNWLLMLNDIISGRLNVLMYARLCDVTNKYPGENMFKFLYSLFHEGDNLLLRKLNKFYDLVKLMPSLAIGAVIRDIDPIPQNQFMNEMLKEIMAKGFNVFEPFIVMLTRPAFYPVKSHFILEVSGLWKLWGHPIVDMDRGVAKVLRLSSEPSVKYHETGKYYSVVFKYHFCKQFFRINHSWPAIVDSPLIPNIIKRNISANTWDEMPLNPWPYTYFDNITFGKTLDFDYHLDAADLLTDSAIIPDFEQWVYEYDRDSLLQISGRVQFPKRKPGRVLLDFLQREEVNLKEEVSKFCRGDYSKSEKVCVIIAKERELKIEPRFFVKQTLFCRFMQTLAEANVKDNIFPYIRFQSMSLSELQLSQRLSNITRHLEHPESLRHVIIVVDFSSWNLRFHHSNMIYLLRDLDNLHGLENFYSKMHQNTESNWIFVQDRFNPPPIANKTTNEPHSCNRAWYGSSTWFEGMLQKCWTLFTFSVILAAAKRMQASISILGQGDNQTILLNIPPIHVLAKKEMTIQDYIDQFLGELERETDNAGLPIKREETWVSFSLMEYSRKYYLKGAQVSCALKRVSRLSSEANQLLPSLSSDISGVFSSSCTIAQEDHNGFRAYLMCIIEANRVLSRYFKEFMPLDERCVLLTNPRITGGLPVSLYSAFVIRGCPDPLTEALSFFRFVYHNFPDSRLFIHKHINLEWSRHRDYKFLIKDPVSLNISLPIQIENYLRNTLEDCLRDFTVNKIYARLFNQETSEIENRLIQDLTSLVPSNPRVMNYLWSLSNIGARDNIVGRFNRTKSIQQVVSSQVKYYSLTKILKDIIYTQVEHYRKGVWSDRCKIIMDQQEWCAMDTSQRLRCESWGMDISGVSMPAICEQWMFVRYANLSEAWLPRAIIFDVDNTLPNYYHLLRGKFAPYFGSKTKERAKKPMLMATTIDPMMSSLKKLLTLKPWLKRGDSENNIGQLVNKLIQEKTSVNLEQLQWLSPEIYSGSIYHRLQDKATDHRSLANNTYNLSTHVKFTSDYATDFAKQKNNYTLFFQLAFLLGISQLNQLNQLGFSIKGVWALVNICPSCTRLIQEEEFDLTTNPSYTGIELMNIISEIHTRNPMCNIEVSVTDPVVSMSVHFGRKLAQILNHVIKYDVFQSQLELSTYNDARSLSLNLTELSRCDLETILSTCYIYLITVSYENYYALMSYLELRIKRDRSEYNAIVQVVEAFLLAEIVRPYLIKKQLHAPLPWLLEPARYVQLFGFLLKSVKVRNEVELIKWNHIVPEDGDEGAMRRIERMKIVLKTKNAPLFVQHSYVIPKVVLNELEAVKKLRETDDIARVEEIHIFPIALDNSDLSVATKEHRHQYRKRLAWRDNFIPQSFIIGLETAGLLITKFIKMSLLSKYDEYIIINDFEFSLSTILLHLYESKPVRTMNYIDVNIQSNLPKRLLNITLDNCALDAKRIKDSLFLNSSGTDVEEKYQYLLKVATKDTLLIIDMTIQDQVDGQFGDFISQYKHDMLLRCRIIQCEAIKSTLIDHHYEIYYSHLEVLNPMTVWIYLRVKELGLDVCDSQSFDLTINYISQELTSRSRTNILTSRYQYNVQHTYNQSILECIGTVERSSLYEFTKDARNIDAIIQNIEKAEDELQEALEQFDISSLKKSFKKTILYNSDLIGGRSEPVRGLMYQYVKLKFIKDVVHLSNDYQRLRFPIGAMEKKSVHVHFVRGEKIKFCESRHCGLPKYFQSTFAFSSFYTHESNAWQQLCVISNKLKESEEVAARQTHRLR